MTLPSISIITPSYNQGRFIERTVRSVLEQDYPALEYQVMDGGSTDDTLEVLRRYQPRLKLISQKDGGQSAALNQGFQRTSGEIVGWINSDDYYLPGALQAVGAHFAAHPGVEWLYGRCPIVDERDREHKRLITLYKELWARRYCYGRLLVENFISQPAVFFRRRLLEKAGLLEPGYQNAMDYHLWLRFGALAEPAFLDRPLACFRSYADNKTTVSFRRTFDEELDAARRVAGGRHPLLVALHGINRFKLLSAYTLLSRLSR